MRSRNISSVHATCSHVIDFVVANRTRVSAERGAAFYLRQGAGAGDGGIADFFWQKHGAYRDPDSLLEHTGPSGTIPTSSAIAGLRIPRIALTQRAFLLALGLWATSNKNGWTGNFGAFHRVSRKSQP